jgi:hypothetical protein
MHDNRVGASNRADYRHSAPVGRAEDVSTPGQPKRTMSDRNGSPQRDQKRREAALAIALRTGLLKKCLCHDEVYDPGQHDYQGACMVASFLINRDDPLVAPFGGDRVPLTELLKAICQLYPLRCSECSKVPV